MEKNNIKDFECIMDMEDMLQNNMCNMDCGNSIDNMPLAMAYVPMQRWKTVYNNDVALNRGTIFPELDLPFLAGRDKE